MIFQLAAAVEEFSIPVYSAGGFASLSATHKIARRALARNVPTVILHLGDFDPSGVSIFDSMMADAAAFVKADRSIATLEIEPVRVALTAEQVEMYDLPTSRSGGTCQLEALPPDVLADHVRSAIRPWVDPDVLEDHREDEIQERAQLLGLPAGGDVS